MKRIVPAGYVVRDTIEVKELRDGGFVQEVQPAPAIEAVTALFRELIKTQGDALAAKYGVANRDGWPEDPHTAAHAPPETDRRLAYVFGEKMSPELANDLYACGLTTSRSYDPRWVGMHPRLADLYMTALAERLAPELGAHPLTDKTFDHVAVSGLTMERLAAALLGTTSSGKCPRQERELEQIMVSIAFRYVVPLHPDAIPVARRRASDTL